VIPSQTLQLVRHIEGLALRAWPAAEQQPLDGWRLRFNAGVTRRANSVWPNDAQGSRSLDDKLAIVEAFYVRRGQPARYQVCPASQPAELSAVLERRGYRADAHTSVQTAETSAVLAATGARSLPSHPVAISDTFDARWFAAYCQAEGVREREAATRRGILQRIAARTAYASLEVDGQAVATGLGVLEDEWLGVFSMATRPESRRAGAATVVLHALAAWGRRRHASHMYLQVMHGNQPARALYQRLGFTTLYDYYYLEAGSVRQRQGANHRPSPVTLML